MRYIVLCVFLLIAACTPTATPFPASLPTTETPTPQTFPTAPPPLRYGIGANAAGYIDDIANIEAQAIIHYLPDSGNLAALGEQVDIIVAFGDWGGWERSPITPFVGLVINQRIAPFNNPELAHMLAQTIDGWTIVEQLTISGAFGLTNETIPVRDGRVQLANNGWPDGVTITLGHLPIPGIEQIIEQMNTYGIEVQLQSFQDTEAVLAALANDRLQAAVIMYDGQQAPQEVIPLYGLPISYIAIENLNITFTSNGWPLIARP